MAWNETLLFYKESPYQRIAFFTEADGSFSLTLDDYWQFNSNVEHIYHECLFTLPALLPKTLENVLVLGGGDGLGARELLKFKSVQSIDLVDLDPEIIKFAKTNVFMKNLNKDSFNDPKVNITVTDAKKWLEAPVTKKYDLIIVDFPDPTTDLLWDLYTVKLYKQMASRLTKNGVIAIQSSTYNTKTFELIYEKLDKVFPFLLGYHTGASRVFCGFFLASFRPIKLSRNIPKSCRWINPEIINQILALPIMQEDTKSTSRLRQNSKLTNPMQVAISNVAVKNRKPEELGSFFQGGLSETTEPTPNNASNMTKPAILAGIALLIAAPIILKYI